MFDLIAGKGNKYHTYYVITIIYIYIYIYIQYFIKLIIKQNDQL